jgi:hypothetical protein
MAAAYRMFSNSSLTIKLNVDEVMWRDIEVTTQYVGVTNSGQEHKITCSSNSVATQLNTAQHKIFQQLNSTQHSTTQDVPATQLNSTQHNTTALQSTASHATPSCCNSLPTKFVRLVTISKRNSQSVFLSSVNSSRCAVTPPHTNTQGY